MNIVGTSLPGAGKTAIDDSLRALREDSTANDRAIDRPRQGLQCAIANSGKCSLDLETPALANLDGKLFFNEANIFRLMRHQWLSSTLPYQYSYCTQQTMPQSINNLQIYLIFQICSAVGELDALFLAPAHDHRLDNTK